MPTHRHFILWPEGDHQFTDLLRWGRKGTRIKSILISFFSPVESRGFGTLLKGMIRVPFVPLVLSSDGKQAMVGGSERAGLGSARRMIRCHIEASGQRRRLQQPSELLAQPGQLLLCSLRAVRR